MRYAVIATYTTGEATGAVVSANERPEAWMKAMQLFGSGEHIQSVHISEVLTVERGGRLEE